MQLHGAGVVLLLLKQPFQILLHMADDHVIQFREHRIMRSASHGGMKQHVILNALPYPAVAVLQGIFQILQIFIRPFNGGQPRNFLFQSQPRLQNLRQLGFLEAVAHRDSKAV